LRWRDLRDLLEALVGVLLVDCLQVALGRVDLELVEIAHALLEDRVLKSVVGVEVERGRLSSRRMPLR